MISVSDNGETCKPETRQPTFEGMLCGRCGTSARFEADCRCVRCHLQWRRDNQARYYRKWGSALFRKLGLTLARYFELCEEQNWTCQICGTVPDKTLCVDHNHKTNEYRGLLCGACNKGLGFFRDDPARLQSAIEYLRA